MRKIFMKCFAINPFIYNILHLFLNFFVVLISAKRKTTTYRLSNLYIVVRFETM
nr:MAG TPA: hypothetical protein [Bacteriophage sp.]